MIECKHKITAFPSPSRKSAFGYKEVAEEAGLQGDDWEFAPPLKIGSKLGLGIFRFVKFQEIVKDLHDRD